MNVSRRTDSVRLPSWFGTAKQIECSDPPCEIMMTEMPCSRSAPNKR